MTFNPIGKFTDNLPLSISAKVETIVEKIEELPDAIASMQISGELYSKIQEIYKKSLPLSQIIHSMTPLINVIQIQILTMMNYLIVSKSDITNIINANHSSTLFIRFNELFELFTSGKDNAKFILFLQDLKKTVTQNAAKGTITNLLAINYICDIDTSIGLINLNSLPALRKTGTFYSLKPLEQQESQTKFCIAVQNYKQTYYHFQMLLNFLIDFGKLQLQTMTNNFTTEFVKNISEFPYKPNVPSTQLANFCLNLLKIQSIIDFALAPKKLQLANLLNDFPLDDKFLGICLGGAIPYNSYFVLQNQKKFSEFLPTVAQFIDKEPYHHLTNIFKAMKNIFPFIILADWERINKRLENKVEDECNSIIMEELLAFDARANESQELKLNIVKVLKGNDYYKQHRQKHGNCIDFIRELNYLLDHIIIPSHDTLLKIKDDVFILPPLYKPPSHFLTPTISLSKITLTEDDLKKKLRSILEVSQSEGFTHVAVPIFYSITNILFMIFSVFDNQAYINVFHKANISQSDFLSLFLESCDEFKNGDCNKLKKLVEDLKTKLIVANPTNQNSVKALKYCDSILSFLRLDNYEILLNPPEFFIGINERNLHYTVLLNLFFATVDIFRTLESIFDSNLKTSVDGEDLFALGVTDVMDNLPIKYEHKLRLKNLLVEFNASLAEDVDEQRLKEDFSVLVDIVNEIYPSLSSFIKSGTVDHKFFEQNRNFLLEFSEVVDNFLFNLNLSSIEMKKQHDFFISLYNLLKDKKISLIVDALDNNCSDDELLELIIDQVREFSNVSNSENPTSLELDNPLTELVISQNISINNIHRSLTLLNQIAKDTLQPQIILLKEAVSNYFGLSQSLISTGEAHAPATFLGKSRRQYRDLKAKSQPFEEASSSNAKPKTKKIERTSKISIESIALPQTSELSPQFKFLQQLQLVKEAFDNNILNIKTNSVYVGVPDALTNAYNHFNNVLSVLYRLNHPSNHPLSPQFIQSIVIDLIRHGSLASEQILLALALESNKVNNPVRLKSFASHSLQTLQKSCKWKKEPTRELERFLSENNFGEIYVRNLNQTLHGKSRLKPLLAKARSLSENYSKKAVHEILGEVLDYSNQIGALFSTVTEELTPIEKSKGKSKVKSKGKAKAKPEEVKNTSTNFYPSFKSFISKLMNEEVFDAFLLSSNESTSLISEEVPDFPSTPLEPLEPFLLKLQESLDNKKISNSVDNIIVNLFNHLTVEYRFNKVINPITAHTHLTNILLLNQMITEEILVNLLKIKDVNVNIEDHNIWEMIEKLGLSTADFSEEENNFLKEGRITRKLVRYPARVFVKNSSAYLDDIIAGLNNAKQLFAKEKFTFDRFTEDGFQMPKKQGALELQNIQEVAAKDVHIVRSLLEKIFAKLTNEGYFG